MCLVMGLGYLLLVDRQCLLLRGVDLQWLLPLLVSLQRLLCCRLVRRVRWQGMMRMLQGALGGVVVVLLHWSGHLGLDLRWLRLYYWS